jgi:hypothetical protein
VGSGEIVDDIARKYHKKEKGERCSYPNVFKKGKIYVLHLYLCRSGKMIIQI